MFDVSADAANGGAPGMPGGGAAPCVDPGPLPGGAGGGAKVGVHPGPEVLAETGGGGGGGGVQPPAGEVDGGATGWDGTCDQPELDPLAGTGGGGVAGVQPSPCVLTGGATGWDRTWDGGTWGWEIWGCEGTWVQPEAGALGGTAVGVEGADVQPSPEAPAGGATGAEGTCVQSDFVEFSAADEAGWCEPVGLPQLAQNAASSFRVAPQPLQYAIGVSFSTFRKDAGWINRR